MQPAGRIEAAIALFDEILGAAEAPADATAQWFFRRRRFIGSSDRRDISGRIWRILRSRRRLAWWLAPDAPSSRLMIGADLLFSGICFSEVQELFSGGRFAPRPLSASEGTTLKRLDGHSLVAPAMPDAVRWEVPDWLMPRFAMRFGQDIAAELAALDNPAPLDLRVNLLCGSREEAQASLREEGIDASPTRFSPVGLRVPSRVPIASGRSFRRGLIEIQDEGSQLVALLVGAEPGMRVADVCAGAGGKTLALAAAMQNRGRIVACDVSPHRLGSAALRLRRAKVSNVELHLLDGAGNKWAKRSQGGFDRVLADVPCSGTGTWRRHPDARVRFSPDDFVELLARQTAILDYAARLVRKGGRLVYATCSLLLEENEDQVTTFLAKHDDFVVVPLAEAWNLAEQPPPGPGKFLCLTPLRHATDGFFAAVLERAT